MKIEIEIYLTKDVMPPLFTTVIVAGGIALWNGQEWISQFEYKHPIQWEVKWWANLIYNEDIEL